MDLLKWGSDGVLGFRQARGRQRQKRDLSSILTPCADEVT